MSTAPAACVPGLPVDVVVMAAGQGTRMKSRWPKVLQRLAGQPLLRHVLGTAAGLGARQAVVITGHGAEAVEAAVADWLPAIKLEASHAALESAAASFDAQAGDGSEAGFVVRFARQQPQLGTGHAVLQALPQLADDGLVLVLSGDVPLIAADTLRALVQASAGEALALLTIVFDDPTGYGRIVRDGDAVRAIVEQRDASPAERAIREVYTGVMAVPARLLRRWLPALSPQNAQGEYYLTDVVRMAVADGVPVRACQTADALQVSGVNSPAQLAALERAWQTRLAGRLMEQGVRLADPARLDVRGQLRCGQDVEIDVNCVFEGEVVLGDGVRVGPNCVLANVRIEAGARIEAFCHIDGGGAGAAIGAQARIGPYARLRAGARLGEQVHVGNFVEIKNATLGAGAKANHLAYLGDAQLGARVNFGAGSITANYDGARKHRTEIGDDVHVGSNCVLVAPLSLGAGSTVGAGSTLTKDLAAGALGVARAKAVSVPGWQRPRKG